jgi:WD40 repeat protein
LLLVDVVHAEIVGQQAARKKWRPTSRGFLWIFQATAEMAVHGILSPEVAACPHALVGQDVRVANPERIGRYRVSRLLGSGAFASVWLGVDETIDQPVTIKVLADNWAHVPDVRNRFVQEARLLRTADSDRVVRMYDIGVLDDGRPYIVMSYADRGTLADRLDGSPLPLRDALHLAVETARAVAVLHRLEVIHRDIKPSNILFQSAPDGGERILIGDLGVAKSTAQASGFTASAGTPGYMAPEQRDAGFGIDVRADVYGLGALTYHLTTGGLYDDVDGLTARIGQLGLPERLSHVLVRALADERERRWADAQAFVDALVELRTAIDQPAGVDPAAEPPRDTGECPYPGLAAFQPGQAAWFFGRGVLVAELVEMLGERRHTGGIQAIVAPSGAGKSSLLRAGLLSKLDGDALPGSAGWPRLVFSPTTHPLRVLAEQVANLTGGRTADELAADPRRCVSLVRDAADRGNSNRPVVVVVDQFEELFTLCADVHERRLFIDILAEIAQRPRGDVSPAALVVAGIRADVYAACADYAPMRAALQDAPVIVGPMSDAELRDAICGPAREVGLDVEPGLVELLLRDLEAARLADGEAVNTYAAGRLPLLAHALRSCWQQREGPVLTVRSYQSTGGISGAIAASADRVYDALDAEAKIMARSLFLRLVKIEKGMDDARRRLSYTDLVGTSRDPHRLASLIDRFTHARLLTRTRDEVEITHEALLRSWPQLRTWIDGDRAGHLIHQRLEDVADAWTPGDDSGLYRGQRLDEVLAWTAETPWAELGPKARAFLDASVRLRRRTKLLRAAIPTVISLLAVIATVAALALFAEQREASAQRDLAVYERIVAEADQLRTVDASVSAQLDVVAHQMRPSEETGARLVQSANASLSSLLRGHTGGVFAVDINDDGTVMATASGDHSVRLWRMSTEHHATPLGRPLTGHTRSVYAVAFSPDGRVLATAGDDKTIRLWDVGDPGDPTPLGRPLTGHDGAVRTLAFSPNGHTLATAGDDRTIRLWDVTDPSAAIRANRVPDAHDGPVRALAFGRDGHTLATAGDDRTLRLWNVTGTSRPTPLSHTPTGHDGVVFALAFSPNGTTVATGSDDRTVRLWNVGNRAAPTLRGQPVAGHTGGVYALAFSPDGRSLATASGDHTARLWNVSTPDHVTPLSQPLAGHAGTVWAVAFTPDGTSLATASHDRNVRLWHLPVLLAGHTDAVWATTFRPDGRLLATTSEDHTIRLWDVTNPARPEARGRPLAGHTGGVYAAAFSPDGHTLATAGGDRTIRLWNVTDPDHPEPLGEPLTGHATVTTSVAFSPDGTTLATASEDRTVRLWDVTDPAVPEPRGEPLTGHTGGVYSVAFSPDGHTLATASGDRTIRLWNVTDPDDPKPLGRPLLGHTAIVRTAVFSPDGHTLATASGDHTTRMWDVSDPTHARPVGEALTGHSGAVYAASFDANGRTLATASDDQTVRLWNVADPAHPTLLPQALTGHTDAILAIAFAPHGHVLATASADHTVRLWRTDPDEAVQSICAATNGAFSAGDWRHFVSSELPYDPPCP